MLSFITSDVYGILLTFLLVDPSVAQPSAPSTSLNASEAAKALASSAVPLVTANAQIAEINGKARDLIDKSSISNRTTNLENAWKLLAPVLSDKVEASELKETIQQANRVIPRLRIDQVKPWLLALTKDNPRRSLELVQSMIEYYEQDSSLLYNPDRRAKLLKLQSGALEAFLANPGGIPVEKNHLLLVKFATIWMKEAKDSQRFVTTQPNQPQPGRRVTTAPRSEPPPSAVRNNNSVSVFDLIEISPSSRFLVAIPDLDFRVLLLENMAKTFLSEDEEERAFDCIEQLTKMKPDAAARMAVDFLHGWMRNHNPNPFANPVAQQQQVIYGANGQPMIRNQPMVPLTKSLQERNIGSLANWVARIRKLPIQQPEESLLIQAFISCYTSNAIFNRTDLQAVFGSPQNLKSESLIRLANQLRNSINMLRMQLAQQAQSRQPGDLQSDLMAGYSMLRSVMDDALQKQPNNWELILSRAVVAFNELDFEHERQPKPDFTKRRADIMAEFARASELYGKQLETKSESNPDLSLYEQWFAISLGAAELQNLTEDKLPDLKQPEKIRAAMLALPGESGERHLSEFAENLYTRLPLVKPAMKPRFLKMGAEVANNHPRLGPARKLLNYYKDLAQEVKLEVSLDGSPAVGASEPFGVFVSLKHTREIEQGSGGFGRFLQNQVGNQIVYNYGRPAANYRDRFENAATAALSEHFEIVSCTFESDKVLSRLAPEPGWRITPYAYLLLKSRGQQIDRLPPLQIDLDFMDHAGYVVLPIESTPIPIDASKRQSRPAEGVEITQTLDERKASDGILRLEIKAAARGLAPDLKELVSLSQDEFEVTKTDAHPLSVIKFDHDSPTPAIRSERSWLLTFKVKPNQSSALFQFPATIASDAQVKWQRYKDADIIPAEAKVVIGDIVVSQAVNKWKRFGLIGGGILAASCLLLWALRQLLRNTGSSKALTVSVPQRLTLFSVLGYLQKISQKNQLSNPQRQELQKTIQDLERHYFSGKPSISAPPELHSIVERWSHAQV